MRLVICALIGGLVLLGAGNSPAQDKKDPDKRKEVGGKTAIQWTSLLDREEQAKKRQGILLILELFEAPDFGVIINAAGDRLKNDTSADVRATAAQLLGRLGGHSTATESDAKKAVRALAPALAKKDEVPEVRRAVAKALGGKIAKVAGDSSELAKLSLAPLADALTDKDAGVQAAAAATLKDFNEEVLTVLPQLLAAAKDAKVDQYARIYVVQTLTKHSKDGSKVVPVLTDMLKDKDGSPVLKQAAVDGLAVYFRDAQPATGALIDVLKDAKSPLLLRQSAAVALAKIQPPSSKVWPTLKDMMTGGEAALRTQAVRLAGKLCRSEKELVPSLIKRCEDDNIDTQVAAIQELGDLGQEAQPAELTLKRLLETTGRPTVRDAAQTALKKIQGKSSD